MNLFGTPCQKRIASGRAAPDIDAEYFYRIDTLPAYRVSRVMSPPIHSYFYVFYICNVTIFIPVFLQSETIGHDMISP